MTDWQHKRRLRQWMIEAHAIGETILCSECGAQLNDDEITIGHWPVPAYLGGTWTRNNVRPECLECNSAEGGAMSNLPAKLVWEIVYERATGFVYRQKMARLGLQPIKVSPNFGKVHRKAVRCGKRWATCEQNTPYRPKVWRQMEAV